MGYPADLLCSQAMVISMKVMEKSGMNSSGKALRSIGLLKRSPYSWSEILFHFQSIRRSEKFVTIIFNWSKKPITSGAFSSGGSKRVQARAAEMNSLISPASSGATRLSSCSRRSMSVEKVSFSPLANSMRPNSS